MEFYGIHHNLKLESGKIYYATKSLISKVWTAEFAVCEEGKVYLISYDNDNEIGYDRDKTFMQCEIIEDSDRNITGIYLGDNLRNSSSTGPKDEFEVVNQKYVFSYKGPVMNELTKYPELRWLATKTVSKKYGLGESKILSFQEFEISESTQDR